MPLVPLKQPWTEFCAAAAPDCVPAVAEPDICPLLAWPLVSELLGLVDAGLLPEVWAPV